MPRKQRVKNIIKFLENEVAKREQAIADFKNDSTSILSRQSRVFRKSCKLSASIRFKKQLSKLAAESKNCEITKNEKLLRFVAYKRDFLSRSQYETGPEEFSKFLEFENRKIDYIFNQLVDEEIVCLDFKKTLCRFKKKENPATLLRLQDMKLIEFDASGQRARLINTTDFDGNDSDSGNES